MGIHFKGSVGPTLGIEMELELVDRGTRELKSAASSILFEVTGSPDLLHPKIKHELLECCLEIITGICTTVGEARRDLEATLLELQTPIADRNIGLLCSGTHPFSKWYEQDVSPGPRYAALMEDTQWAGRRLQIFGVHFHVGVSSGTKAIAITNALASYIPHFLALSSSSPFWGGHDTGLASARSKVFEALPTAGLPYMLGSWEEFEQFMDTLISAHAIKSIREVWWDIRPHPEFGTVEIRVCDGLPSFAEVEALAALAQCLVAQLDGLDDRGFTLPAPREWIVRQNKWRAGRYGLEAEIIVDESGTLLPLRQAIAHTVEELTPTASRLGCDKELAGVLDIMNRGPSATRQRDIVARGGSLLDVVDALVDELDTGAAKPAWL
ncbi:MAG TPA: glutamate--cysteine ligase [Acidimicrobiales bacterium]|nr:glutamate--cysteine ligase [Acidimicrobiales bacterium]